MSSLSDGAINPTLRVRDISRTFTLVRAEECPVTTIAVKGPKPKSTLYEWLAKRLHAPSDNAVPDLQEVQAGEIINNEANKAAVQGRVQKGRVVVGIDDVAEEFGLEYGIDRSLLADNVMDGIILSRENLEFTSIKTGDSAPYLDANNPRKLRGLAGFIRSANPDNGDLPVSGVVLTPAGNIKTGKANANAVTEEDLLDILQSIVTTCRQSRNLHVYASPALRRRISRYTKTQPEVNGEVAVRSFQQDAKSGELMMKVERISCDFGTFYLHTHMSLPNGVHCLILDMSMVKMRPGRPPSVKPLEYRGGAHLRMIEYITGLEVTNPQAHGKITT